MRKKFLKPPAHFPTPPSGSIKHPNAAFSIIRIFPNEASLLLGDRAAAGKYQPSQKLTVRQANIPVALLVGFWGRTGDGHPGPQILAEGLRMLRACSFRIKATWVVGVHSSSRMVLRTDGAEACLHAAEDGSLLSVDR